MSGHNQRLIWKGHAHTYTHRRDTLIHTDIATTILNWRWSQFGENLDCVHSINYLNKTHDKGLKTLLNVQSQGPNWQIIALVSKASGKYCWSPEAPIPYGSNKYLVKSRQSGLLYNSPAIEKVSLNTFKNHKGLYPSSPPLPPIAFGKI